MEKQSSRKPAKNKQNITLKKLVLQGVKYFSGSLCSGSCTSCLVLIYWYDLETKSMRKVLLLSIFCTKHCWKWNVVLQMTCIRDHVAALCAWRKCCQFSGEQEQEPPSPGYCSAAFGRKGRRSGPLQLPGRLGTQAPGQGKLLPDGPTGGCIHSPARPLSSLLTSWTDSPVIILLLLPDTYF